MKNKGYYENGLGEGVLETYYENGKINVKQEVKAGIKNGVTEVYDIEGNLKEKQLWINGKINFYKKKKQN